MRPSKRKNNQLREVAIETGYLINNKHSCLIKIGNTHVICSATLEDEVPRFLKKTGKGWLTAEYSMLPTCSNQRIKRESSQGKVSGRTQEIQRLIGRSLRAAIDLSKLGERQIIIDCDVINADGGTRTASITGGYVALQLLIHDLLNKKILYHNPMISQIAAISCGVYNGEVVLDLDYDEDSDADIDGNFIMTGDGKIIEIQISAEKDPCSEEQFQSMLLVSKEAISKLCIMQNKTLLKI